MYKRQEQSKDWNIYIGSTGSPSSDMLCSSNTDVSGGDVITVTCDSTLTGRYVTATSDTWMVLCEIDVYGKITDNEGNVLYWLLTLLYQSSHFSFIFVGVN